MLYDVNYQPYASNRYPLFAKNGMVSTANNLASAAGLEMLRSGGNAVDAAIATAAALTVVEPTSNGLGSDAFAIVWFKNKMSGLNSSGPAPMAISKEALKAQGHSKMPTYGWTPVTVPGAVKAWSTLWKTYGSLPFAKLLEPAIRYAQEGYPCPAQLSYQWQAAYTKYKKEFKDDVQFQEWFKTFTFNGNPPKPGELVKLPNHAKSLRLLAESDGDSLYYGELADKVDEVSRKFNGYLRKEDLKAFTPQWVEPISVNYHGYDVWEIPPNGQGIVALMALNILKEFHFDHRCGLSFHHQFEAMKMAFADGMHYVSDPQHMKMECEKLLDPLYGKKRAASICEYAQDPKIADPYQSGTVYLCTGDAQGNMVSYIQSNYMGFGSGIVIDDCGIALQNRGADFSLEEDHVNTLEPGKRTYHTIIPGFLTKDGKAVGPFGVMGGYMQPQGHVQVLMNMIDYHLNPQMALDAPRWQWVKGKKFIVEPSFATADIYELQRRGHEIEVCHDIAQFGRGQIIQRLHDEVYVGGCESRSDSNIACF